LEQTFILDDFIKIKKDYMYGLEKYMENWICYNLNRECVIMNKLIDASNETCEELTVTPLSVMIFKEFELPMKISQINNYITWLGSKCMKDFIKYFHCNYEKITDATKHIGDDWYYNTIILEESTIKSIERIKGEK